MEESEWIKNAHDGREARQKKCNRQESEKARQRRRESSMNIMWPISQSHFHVSRLCSLKQNLFIIIPM